MSHQQKLGSTVRIIARIRGVRMTELAADMGWSEQTLHSRLSGASKLGVDEMIQLAELLDVDIPTLLQPPSDLLNHASRWIIDSAGELVGAGRQ